jgi:polysaccharide biosynthesis/export protein
MCANCVEALAAAVLAAAVCLSGCGISITKDAEAGLAERPLAERTQSGAAAFPAREQRVETAQLTEVADTFAPASMPGNTAYKIGPLDVLDISVFKVPELSKSVQVADAGTINLPLVGELPAAGKTAREVERDLSGKLGAKFLRNPQVTVFVKEHNSQRVTIEGAVKKPGIYPIKGKTSLLQVLAMAESPDKETASSVILVFRTTGGKRSAARFDIDDIRGGKAEDPLMQEGDVVIVDTSTSKLVLNTFFKVLPTATAFVPLL